MSDPVAHQSDGLKKEAAFVFSYDGLQSSLAPTRENK